MIKMLNLKEDDFTLYLNSIIKKEISIMRIKKKYIALVCAISASLMTSSGVRAEDVEGSVSLLFSPHTTKLSAPQYLQALGQLPIDHTNRSNEYYGLQGEVNYGRYLLSLDYLTGLSKTVVNGLDMSPNSTLFNPLSHETSEVVDLRAGYTFLNNGPVGTIAATLGYFRLWASPAISPPNWYDGVEFGVNGKYCVNNLFSLTYKLGYVPDVSVHGYMKDDGLMEGRYLVNYKIGAEVPIIKDFSIIGGYQSLRAVNKVILPQAYGSAAVVKFTGCYIGGSYNF